MDQIGNLIGCVNGPSNESKCAGQTLPLSDSGVQAFVGQIISIATSFITIAAGYLGLGYNYLLALNAGRCAIANGFYNVWYLMAAVMYLANQFNLGGQIQMYFNMAYPYVCGCYYYASKVSAGGTNNKQLAQKIAVYFSSCDEAGMILNNCTYSNGTVYQAIYCPS